MPATVEDLYATEGKAELVGGRLVLMPPTGRKPGRAALKIALSLEAYAQATGRGEAVGNNVGFIVNLPNRKSFSPDVAFLVGADSGMEFYEGAPVFASEVRSKGDYGAVAERELAAKRADYFAAGTVVVWDVDLLADDDVVRVYRSTDPDVPARYQRGQTAEAEPALPGWTMKVDEIFDGEP